MKSIKQIYEKIVNLISKASTPFIWSIVIGIVFQTFTRMSQNFEIRRKSITSGKRSTRLFLKNNKKYTREEIIKLGRNAIRCKLTNKLLKNPVVGKDGYSYEKENYNDLDGYENRMLKEFIEKSNEIYHLNI